MGTVRCWVSLSCRYDRYLYYTYLCHVVTGYLPACEYLVRVVTPPRLPQRRALPAAYGGHLWTRRADYRRFKHTLNFHLRHMVAFYSDMRALFARLLNAVAVIVLAVRHWNTLCATPCAPHLAALTHRA